MKDKIDAAFDTLKMHCLCRECEGCRFLDEDECCIFGTIAPWEWKMPRKEDAEWKKS